METYYPQTVIYEEKKTTYWIFGLMLFFIGMMVFLGYLQIRASLGYFIILPFVGLFFGLFIFYNISFYSVKIFDDKTIQFGFPAWNKKLQPSEINSIEEISLSSNTRIRWFRLEDWKTEEWKMENRLCHVASERY